MTLSPPRHPPPGRSTGPGPDLDFAVEDAAPLTYAASPGLLFRLRITERQRMPVRSVLLNAQIRIDAPARASYSAAEQEGLREVFGPPARWGETLKSLLWTQTTLVVPPFDGGSGVTVEVPIACTYDFEVVSAKYLHALASGEIPLEFLFSGTVFYSADDGAGSGGSLQAVRISWEKAARCRLPVALWKQAMDHFFPGSAWLRLRGDVFDRLYDYRTRNGLPTWEAALEELLNAEASAKMPATAAGAGGRP